MATRKEVDLIKEERKHEIAYATLVMLSFEDFIAREKINMTDAQIEGYQAKLADLRAFVAGIEQEFSINEAELEYHMQEFEKAQGEGEDEEEDGDAVQEETEKSAEDLRRKRLYEKMDTIMAENKSLAEDIRSINVGTKSLLKKYQGMKAQAGL